jgi:hypothetical protein
LEESTNGKTLHAWKEIAAHLGVVVRSVQRWEKYGGLPVYRQGSGKKSRVFAYAAELDKWREAGGIRRSEEEARKKASLRPTGLSLALVVIAVVAAGVVLWRMGVLSRARIPHGYVLEGSVLTVVDAEGRPCWKRSLPRLNAHFAAEVRDHVHIGDIDGDGRTEVLFNFFPQDLSRSASSLMCFSQTGELRWEFRYGAPQTFGGRKFEADYKGHLIRPARIGNKPYLVTVANHYRWYPAQMALLDAATGRAVETYWHPGAIYHCRLADIDRDGVDEVVFGAINNPGEGLGHAALGVLKLPFSKAPRRKPAPGDPFRALTGGGELAYFLFPLSDVSLAMGLLPIPVDLSIRHNGIDFEVPTPESGGIVYSLDYNLRLRECRFSDNFAPLHNRLFHERLLDHALGVKETASLSKPIPFAAAPDGNHPQLKRLWQF